MTLLGFLLAPLSPLLAVAMPLGVFPVHGAEIVPQPVEDIPRQPEDSPSGPPGTPGIVAPILDHGRRKRVPEDRAHPQSRRWRRERGYR